MGFRVTVPCHGAGHVGQVISESIVNSGDDDEIVRGMLGAEGRCLDGIAEKCGCT